MKKLLLTILLALSITLVACSEEEPYTFTEITFNGETYEFLKTEDNYDIYIYNGHTIEVQYGRITTLTTELDGDIYIIQGEKDDYSIRKNGETILICSGTEIECTGFENVDFKLDFITIIEEYEKE